MFLLLFIAQLGVMFNKCNCQNTCYIFYDLCTQLSSTQLSFLLASIHLPNVYVNWSENCNDMRENRKLEINNSFNFNYNSGYYIEEGINILV